MILLVDDSAAIQNQICAFLVERGHTNVAIACSAEEARAALNGEGPGFDLVLLDVHLPGEDGLSFCAFLQTQADLRDVPVLIMTADSSDEMLESAFRAGARDFVRKPLARRELNARVEAALSSRRLLQQKALHLIELRELNEILQKANLVLQEKATLDALTGLANRRQLDYYLGVLWEDARNTEKTISFLMIDVDEFKAYNDTYGHPAGDVVLARVASAIESSLVHPAYFAARYGGEEFSVVLPAADRQAAAALAERTRAAVQALSVEHKAAAAPVVTVSVGVATRLPRRHESASEIVGRADRALYAAKRNGRNCVVVDDIP